MSYANKDFDPNQHDEQDLDYTDDVDTWSDEVDPEEEAEKQPSVWQRIAGASASTRVALALIALALLFLVMIGIWRATTPEPIRPTTMNNTAELVRQALYDNDFDKYKELFKDSHQDKVLETDFRNLQLLATEEASSADYTILRMSNGRQLLVAMEHNAEDDEFDVLFVVEVPTAMKELFTDRTLSDESSNMIPVPIGNIPATQPSETTEPVETTLPSEEEPSTESTEEITEPEDSDSASQEDDDVEENDTLDDATDETMKPTTKHQGDALKD